MDTIMLTKDDMDFLNKWGAENVDKFSFNLCPIKKLKIDVPEVKKTSIKCFRNEKDVTLQINIGGISYGHIKMLAAPEVSIRHYKLVPSKKADKLKHEFLEGIGALYAQIMAFMVYGNNHQENTEQEPIPVMERKTEKIESNKKQKEKVKSKVQQASGIVYILKRNKGRTYFVEQGGRARPQGIFGVRGHYRHYRNGNVVWIAEYAKGTGDKKKKDKKYKLKGGD